MIIFKVTQLTILMKIQIEVSEAERIGLLVMLQPWLAREPLLFMIVMMMMMKIKGAPHPL